MKESTQKEDVEKDVNKYKSISALRDSEGGKILLASTLDDAASAIDEICSNYKKLSHTEFISLGAKLQTNISLARVLLRARKNAKMASEVLKNLVEDPEE